MHDRDSSISRQIVLHPPNCFFFNKCCPGRYSKPIFPNPYVVVNSFTLTPQCWVKGRILGAPTVETSSFGRSQIQFVKLNASTYYEDEFEIFSPAMEFSFCFHIQNVVKNTFTILAYHASCQQNLTRNLDRWQQLASPTKLLRMVGRTQALYPKIGGAVKSQTPKKKTLAIFSDHTKLPFLWG